MQARWLATGVAVGVILAGLGAPGVASAVDRGQEVSTSVEFAPDGDASIVTVANPTIDVPRTATGAAIAESDAWAASFGNADPVLRVVDQTPLDGGRTATRVAQSFAGAEVIAGELVVVTDANGALLTISGGLAADPAVTTWSLTQSAARRAVHGAAKVLNVSRAVFDDSLIGGDDDSAHTAWQVEYRTSSGALKRAFVDATTARVLFTETRQHALSRVVCDGSNRVLPMDSANCTMANAARVEGGEELVGSPTVTIDPVQVNEGYDTLGRTSALFEKLGVNLTDLIGSDAGDGNGKQLRLYVRYCPEKSVDSCPMSNAFWLDDEGEASYTGGVMYAGNGLATSDDVTAHELAHGVTSATSKLIYSNEPGAISESISDVFGELVDQSELLPSEDPKIEDFWYIGEAIRTKDLVGPVRSMSDPTQSFLGAPHAPDRMGSPYWWTKNSDDGGVHINSGVGNKAAYLMGHGGQFRGITVQPIGLHKLAHLYWEVEQRLAPSSRYAVLGSQLRQACAELIATQVNGYSEDDCAQVDAAVRATQMTAQRATMRVESGSVRYGKSNELRVRLTDAVTTGEARVRVGVDLTVEAQSVLGDTWQPVGTMTTNGYGIARMSIKPKLNTRYRVTAPASGPWTGTQVELLVKVKPTLTITKSLRKPYTLVTGTSFPYVDGGHVVLQKRQGRHWSTVAESGIAKDGGFRLSPKQVGVKGTFRVVRHPVGGLASVTKRAPRTNFW